MKTLYTLVVFCLFSCCLGSYKCRLTAGGGSFRIIRGVNGDDLVFGSTRIYNKDETRFYYLKGQDTTELTKHLWAPTNTSDSIITIGLLDSPETIYIELNQFDTDTLTVQYDTDDNGPCCPDTKSIVSFKYNNSQTFLGVDTVHELKK